MFHIDSDNLTSMEQKTDAGVTVTPVRRSQRKQRKLCSVTIDSDIFENWCRVGVAEGLNTDTEIARFFLGL